MRFSNHIVLILSQRDAVGQSVTVNAMATIDLISARRNELF